MTSLLLIRSIRRKLDLKRVFSTVSQDLTRNDEQSIDLSLSVINDYTKNEPVKNLNPTFASLFKKSKFVAMGNLRNKTLIGKIVDTVGDDLYIDFGGKFNCVCKRPVDNGV